MPNTFIESTTTVISGAIFVIAARISCTPRNSALTRAPFDEAHAPTEKRLLVRPIHRRPIRQRSSAAKNMQPTREQLWDALCRIGSGEGTADKILPEVIAELIEFKMVEPCAAGVLRLTPYGEKCFVVMEMCRQHGS